MTSAASRVPDPTPPRRGVSMTTFFAPEAFRGIGRCAITLAGVGALTLFAAGCLYVALVLGGIFPSFIFPEVPPEPVAGALPAAGSGR